QWVALIACGFADTGGTLHTGFGPRWFISNQMWGALLAYGVYLVWDGYRTASRDWRKAGPGAPGISPSGAMAGFAVCVLLLTAWNLAAGGSLWIELGGMLFWIATM